MQDLISIITPLYNAEAWIKETAESVLKQTYQNWEWIIVNDCSKDSSVRILKELIAGDPRVIFVENEKNLGPAGSRNKALDFAKGKYIAFIDSDDLWHPLKLSKQIAFMQSTGTSLSYHSFRRFKGDFSTTSGTLMSVPERVTRRDLLKSNIIMCSTAMYNAEKVGKVEMQDGYKREDLLAWLKILTISGDSAQGISECLGYYRVHGNSYSAKKLEMAHYQWRVYREVEGLDVLSSSFYFAFYAVKGALKSRAH
jgi:teichuronic acid biosynthesis glycosyltransferase TuaG